MSTADSLPYTSVLDDYERFAQALLADVKSGADEARWRFKWEHPRFKGKPVDEVDSTTLDLGDARLVIARDYGFDTWADLARFSEAVKEEGTEARFEAAVEAVVSGDVGTLERMVHEHPELIHARSTRRHHATLLHYIAANGVENARQRTPPNAVDVARMLLEAGAEVDALAEMYDATCTTMSMLVSSAHPASAGLQVPLAELLFDHGAAIEGPGSRWKSAVTTALAFGYAETAQALVRRGALVDNLATAAGLGRLADAVRLLPAADAETRHVALALAAQHGHAQVVRLLLDAGESPDRYNPDGFHAHSTPLHQAVWANHSAVVQLLVERGAREDIEDTIYHGTPLDWADYGGRDTIADYLRSRKRDDGESQNG
jgi:ankyrin repeat protein